MEILLYHFGYRGDILVTGQNFTRELMARFPGAAIDLMLRPRMREAQDFLEPLGIYRQFKFGEKIDFHTCKNQYDQSYTIDELVYPEGNLRTVFTRAGFPFRLHPLTLVTAAEDEALADRIISGIKRPLIATQADMSRKWPEERVTELWKKLQTVGSLLVVGPEIVHSGCNRPLTFRESAAILRRADIFAGIDSGIAHAAALVGTQTVLIPPVFPESWISPTEYANPFIAEEAKRHLSLRPPADEFCGHYFCLRSTKEGGIQRSCGDPMRVGCDWKRRFWVFKEESCFRKISVDTFFQTVVTALEKRGLL